MGVSPGASTLLTTSVENQYIASGLENGKAYYFSVSAVNAYGEGKPSTEVSVTPGFFDHNAVVGQACAQSGCHDGISPPISKPPTHPLTTNLCEACHTTVNWSALILPFDHSQTFDQCLRCHNNNIATGKPGFHPPTTDVCEACHTQSSWVPLILPFDHSQAVTTSCVSSGCHIAQLPPGHCATATIECGTCHIPGSWIPADSCVPAPPPANAPPVAVITAPLSASVGTAVMFDGSGSADPEGMPLTYNWNIEGTTYTGVTVTHIFNNIGQYVVTLTVSDGNQLSSDEHVINIIIPGGGMGGGGGGIL